MTTPSAPIEIRPACAGDVPLILRCIRELAVQEKAKHEVFATEASLRDTLSRYSPSGPRRRSMVRCRIVHGGSPQ
jgi:hypothetical protein